MNDFKKHNRFGGGNTSGGDRRGGFGGGFNRAPLELFRATCASCSKSCEVPFRPNGKKPVYCKECFAANGGPAMSQASQPAGERFTARREFSRASEYKPDNRPQADNSIVELRKQIDSVNTKLDKLITMMAEGKTPVTKEIETETKSETKPVKKPGKKPSKK